MKQNVIIVELFTIPQAACDSGKANWTQVGEMIKRQLTNKFGEAISFSHIEFMSEQWFANPKASELLESGEINFPFVLVNGEIASADKKINVSKVTRAILQQ
ncbi:MAG TPA: hypothetical protein VIK55_00030 [Paludibacter sp.]